MTVLDRLLKLNKRLEVYSTIGDKIGVHFEYCYVKGNGVLIGAFGTGNTIYEACEDYINQISGKTLVFTPPYGKREEVTVIF